ncbi:MAG TPA: Cof-type HAD-IIB family hydrolase [Candidatus Mediterraneibacter excrementavium]|nr:Cof-type HAD-IIB family hydrolase [Candidatus Mediterraneibacter excrementavium]
MIRLIASDLDGTLLQNGAQELTPRAIELIHALTQKGIHFIAASGRQYDNERRLFAPIRDEISYIAENGSLCIHQGKVISRGIIPDDLAYRIMADIKKEPGYEILVSREDSCFIEPGNPDFVNHIVNVMKNTTQVVDDVTKLKGPFLKLATANMVSHDVSDCLRRLQEKYSPALKVVTSGNIWIDFIVPGYNKGTALQTFLDLFGVKPEECIAFGDQYNDIEMLELAGQGYAMSTAAPGIAAHAEYVTDSVEEVLEDVLAGLDQTN